MSKKRCSKGKIINPSSGRCVLKTGKIGRDISTPRGSRKRTPSRDRKRQSHKRQSHKRQCGSIRRKSAKNFKKSQIYDLKEDIILAIKSAIPTRKIDLQKTISPSSRNVQGLYDAVEKKIENSFIDDYRMSKIDREYIYYLFRKLIDKECVLSQPCIKYSDKEVKSLSERCEITSKKSGKSGRSSNSKKELCKKIHLSPNVYNDFKSSIYNPNRPKRYGKGNIFSRYKLSKNAVHIDLLQRIKPGFLIYYLMRRHKDQCIIKQHAMWTCSFNGKGTLTISDNLFKKCGSRYSVAYLTNTECDDPSVRKHANLLIIDHKLGTLERFDPLGIKLEWFNVVDLDEQLEKVAKRHNLKYFSPLEYCPVGPQRIDIITSKKDKVPGDPTGFCALWTYFYADQRLQHPDLSREEVIDLILHDMQKMKTNPKDFIRQLFITIYEEIFGIMRDMGWKGKARDLDDLKSIQKFIDKHRKEIIEEYMERG